MKALLLDGSLADDRTGERVGAALTAELKARGWDVEHVVLREKNITPCAGDFFCWIRTPGECVINDDSRAIAAAMIASDLMVYLTPVTFGGYGSTLKRVVDRQIPIISPFFTAIEGETHHHKRYARYPDFLAVGWLEAPDAHAEAVFRHLAQRNALNFYAGTHISDVVLASRTDEELLAAAQGWLNDLENRRSSPAIALPTRAAMPSVPGEIRRALLLVGSPKMRASTSQSLGAYLFEQFSGPAIQTGTLYLYPALRSADRMSALLEAVETADLVVLAFPLYVDALPAPVIEGLERIAAHRQEHAPSRPQTFTVIANCGFPEAQHCATALAITETFSRQAGFSWPGGLAMGGGRVLNGTPLAQAGAQTLPIRKALEETAQALARGWPIPPAAQEMLARPIMPPAALGMFRVMGGLFWVFGALKYGALGRLNRRPYAPKGE